MQRIGEAVPQPVMTGALVYSAPDPGELRVGFKLQHESSHGCLDASCCLPMGGVKTISWENDKGEGWWFPSQSVARPA